MKKILPIILVTLAHFNFIGQNLRTINNTDKNYKINIPENWVEKKQFYSSSLSLMALRPKTKFDKNRLESISIRHIASQKTNFNDSFNEYLKKIKDYHKEKIKIVNREELNINGRKLIKIITKITSSLNGSEQKNIMIYAFRNQELTEISLTSSENYFNKYASLYKKIYSSFVIKNNIKDIKTNDFNMLIMDVKNIDLNNEQNLSKLKSKYSLYKFTKKGMILDDNTVSIKKQINSMKVGEIIKNDNKKFVIKLLSITNQENANVSSINLIDSSKESEKIIKKYKKGISFLELAEKYSTDKVNAKKSASKGWLQKGQMKEEIDKAIFSHKKGDIFSINIKNKGWSIILINENPIAYKKAELMLIQK